MSKNTDKLSTEAPSDEEYLKLFQEEKNVRTNVTFGKMTQNSVGEVRIFLGKPDLVGKTNRGDQTE